MYFRELIGTVSMEMKGTQGLRSGPNESERDKLRSIVAAVSEHQMLLTLIDKGVQGRMLTWENTMQLDLGWSKLIYNFNMSPSLLKFHLNSMHDVAHTPANMRLWNLADVGNCKLCGWRTCNIKHILAVCPLALKGSRFNWRHDNVLRVIVAALLEVVVRTFHKIIQQS